MDPRFENSLANLVCVRADEVDTRSNIVYMKEIIKHSKMIHMWPLENKSANARIMHNLIVWLILSYCTLIALSFFIQINLAFSDVGGNAQTIDYITVFISATFRYAYVYVRGSKYSEIAHLIRHNFIHNSFFSPGNSKISLKQHYKFARRIVVVYTYFTFFWILQVCFLPLARYTWTVISAKINAPPNGTETQIPFKVPASVYFPFDYSQQPAAGFVYAIEITGFILFASIYILVDDFWYMVILLTIGQLDLLKASFQSVMSEINDRDTPFQVHLIDGNQLLQVEARMNICINHHRFLREFIILLNDLFNPNVLVDTFHAIISIAFILLEVSISIKKRIWRKLLHNMQFLIASLVHMYIFHWLADELSSKEEELSDAVYELPWYKFPSQKTKIILSTMTSRRPTQLSGGRMYKLSLRFFTSTIRVIFSGFTFLLQLKNSRG